ncbi:hypothetical protein MMC07_006446 [Pseudocyphellaria aurata]|nr:hypothetical protein [Pseudocyphellaria aurata]
MEADIYLGHFITPSYNAGYVILSYLVSFTGCWTALELLHRRTSARGMYNWYLLLGAATAMGAVAIWCMHYIGNHAIQMLDGQEDLQIQYSPAYTVGSFILPIGIEGIAFYCFSQTDHVKIHGTILGGFMTGLGICGMHYTGEIGISNYAIFYSWRHIVGSAFIAVAANTAALGLSFYFTSTWTNSVWKRIGCALVLALSVSGMHWVASRGTYYRYAANSIRHGLSRQGVAFIVLFWGVGCCITLIILAVIGSRLKKQYAHRARQVVLASATFDLDGRLLVTPGGQLPCRKITNSYIEGSFEEVFDTSHPAFCWVFRASHCWQSVKRLIPGIRAHLRATGAVKTIQPESKSSFSDTRSIVAETSDDYSSVFKELFCVAAKDLATLIQQPLEEMGVLFEDIMKTGTVRKATRRYTFSKFINRNNLDDSLEDFIEAAEKGKANIIFGRGQLLFLTRCISSADSIPMKALGYRFASIPNVIGTLARSMQVTKQELLPFLENLQKHAGNERIIEPGVHVACFALRPLFQRGFGVAVRKDARNLLPSHPLALSRLERSHTVILNHMDNWTVAMCCDWLRERSLLPSATKQKFYGQLLESISKLATQIEQPFFHEARLVARPFNAPCRMPSTSHALGFAAIIAFRIMVDAHQPTTINSRLMFTPSRFFLCQQRVYKDSPDHAAFAGRMHRELAALAQNSGGKDKSSIDSNARKSLESLPHRHLDIARPDGASQLAKNKDSFSEEPSASVSPCQDKCIDIKQPVATNPTLPFGGILVSNEIRVDVCKADGEDNIAHIGRGSAGTHTEVIGAASEPDTFADLLMALTTNEMRHTRSESAARPN